MSVRDRNVGGSTSSVALMMRLAFGKPREILYVTALGVLIGLSGWMMAFYVKWVLDHTSEPEFLTVVAVVVALVFVLRAALVVVRRHVQIRIVKAIEARFANEFLTHAISLETNHLDSYASAEIYGRLKGLEHFRSALEDRMVGLLLDVVVVFVAGVVMAFHDPTLAVLGTLGAAMPALAVRFLRDSIQRSFKKTQDSSARLTNDCMDVFDGRRDLRALGGERYALGRLVQSHASAQESRARHMVKLSTIGTFTGLLSTLALICILSLGAKAVHSRHLTPGDLMFIYTLSGTMLGPLENLVMSWLFYDEAAVALGRCEEILRLPIEQRTVDRKSHSFRGHIRIENLTFAYRPGRPVLQDITLEIPANTTVAVVGESGAGKSSLLGLLAGLYSPERGRITIDGCDLRDIRTEEWRKSLGAVFQSPHLFEGTIEENLRLGCDEASEDQVLEAMRLACLDDVIGELPKGIQTRLTRDAARLSAGQVQRIAIARALVRKPRVLLLDEATSNLDARAEATFWSLLLADRRPRTTVFVTHRLASSTHADVVVVLKSGRVVEVGKASDLYERRGDYYSLWQRQMSFGHLSLTDASPSVAARKS
jgi:ATP-binding cassette subfamily B protein